MVKVTIAVVILIVRAIGAGDEKPAAAIWSAGDCLKGNVEDAGSVTDAVCGPDAMYQVLGAIENKAKFAFTLSDDVCAGFPTAASALWLPHRDSQLGTVFCLADLKNPREPMPAVAECVKGNPADAKTLKKVACGQEADYKVVAHEKGAFAAALDGKMCIGAPTTGAAVIWPRLGNALNSNTVICLEDVRSPYRRRPIVGECVIANDGKPVEVADCGRRAGYRVLGRIDDTDQRDTWSSTKEVCAAFPAADQVIWWHFEKAFRGTTYCVKTVRN